MDNNTNYNYDPNVVQLNDATTASRRYMANVFLWMFLALGISAFCAYLFATTPSLLIISLIDVNTGKPTGLGLIALFGPLAFRNAHVVSGLTVFLTRYWLCFL